MIDSGIEAKRISFNRDVPIVAHTNVLVIGGGPAGIGAAIGAARAGATTVLVERYGFLGGMATAGLVGPFMTCFRGDSENQVIKGVFDELVRRMEALGGAIAPEKMHAGSPESGFWVYGHNHVTPFDSETLKLVADEMMASAGVQLFLHTNFIEPIMEGKRVRGAVIHNKSGLQAIAAEVVVDCSADADVAFQAGAPTVKGRSQDGLMQPMTTFFQVGNVDDDLLDAHLAAHPEVKLNMFRDAVELARARGEWSFARDKICIYRSVQSGTWRVNTTRVVGKDGTNAQDLTSAELEGRKQVLEVLRALRNYVPGFQHAVLWNSGTQIGVRETRHIVGEYVLTAEDLINGTCFEDTIALASYPIDIHNPTGAGGGLQRTAPLYQIPYRTLIPLKIDQLLVAGRCISATHEAAGAIRVMPPCFATGQAAGVAAAISVQQEVAPRNVDVGNLQRVLLTQDVVLPDRLAMKIKKVDYQDNAMD